MDKSIFINYEIVKKGFEKQIEINRKIIQDKEDIYNQNEDFSSQINNLEIVFFYFKV